MTVEYTMTFALSVGCVDTTDYHQVHRLTCDCGEVCFFFFFVTSCRLSSIRALSRNVMKAEYSRRTRTRDIST